MKFKSLALVGAVAFLCNPVFAQQAQGKAPSPEDMKKIMEATMGAMVPVMGAMTDAMIEAPLAAAAKPETAMRIASFKKNLYEALLKQGFNGQDAMHITIATSPPSATPSSK